MRFSRAEGLGNDYLVVETEPEDGVDLTPATIRLLCDRHRGVGGDGILCPAASHKADFGVRIFNPDGSEAEKSGNGLRIFARYLLDAGLAADHCTIETLGGVAEASFEQDHRGNVRVTIDMGAPVFDVQAIPFACDRPEAIEHALTLTRATVTGTAVSMGNPHWVVFCDQVDDVALATLGPEIERHPRFANRTNVQFAEVLSPHAVRVRIWERGAGETLASGSSACAVVAAGIRTGRLSHAVSVSMPGGTLSVRRDPRGHLLQTGSVNVLATGTVAPDLLRRLQALQR